MLAGCPWLQVEGVRHVSPREHEWPEQGSPGPAGGGVAGPPEPCQRPTVRPRNAGILQMTLGERPPGRWVHMRGGGAGSLAGGRRGLVLPRLGLGGGVPGQQQLLDGAVRRALRGEAVFLEEGKGGWPRLTGRGRRGAGRSPGRLVASHGTSAGCAVLGHSPPGTATAAPRGPCPRS